MPCSEFMPALWRRPPAAPALGGRVALAAAGAIECLYSPGVLFNPHWSWPGRLGLLACIACALAACSPSLNWRQVRPDGADMTLLLPCKPDRASKTVPLGARATRLSMTGCEAGGAMYALALADLDDASQAATVLAQWQKLSLSHMQAASATQRPATVPGADAQPAPVLVSARGRHPDGQAVEGQALYFARGKQVFQAVIYAPRIDADAAETFLGSLKLP